MLRERRAASFLGVFLAIMPWKRTRWELKGLQIEMRQRKGPVWLWKWAELRAATGSKGPNRVTIAQ